MEEGQEASGVTGQVADTPISDADTSPVSEHQGENQTAAEEQSEYVSRLEYNKRMEAERKLRSALQKREKEFQQYQPLVNMYQWVNSDESRQQAFNKFIYELYNGGGQGQQGQQDPYADFEPEVAERFRKLDQFEQMFEQMKQEKLAQHQMSIEDLYLQDLKKNQFLNDKFEPVDEDAAHAVSVIDMAIQSALLQTAKDPYRPTREEYLQAQQTITKGLSALEKRALKKTFNSQNNVPPTGSKTGNPVLQKGPRTDQERISGIAAALKKINRS